MSKQTLPDDALVREVAGLKRLMILALLRNGATQEEVAAALGVNQSSISRMFPAGLGRATKPPKAK